MTGTLAQGAPVRARATPGSGPWSAIHRYVDPGKDERGHGDHRLEGIVDVRAVRESVDELGRDALVRLWAASGSPRSGSPRWKLPQQLERIARTETTLEAAILRNQTCVLFPVWLVPDAADSDHWELEKEAETPPRVCRDAHDE